MGRPLNRRCLGALLLIVLVGALLRVARPGVDLPPRTERTNSPLQDAYWYLEAAAGPAEGSQPESLLGYDIPVWTSLARVWLEVFGVSLTSVQALAAFVSLASLLLLWRILRASLDDAAALTGAAIMATLYPCVVLSRTTLIYGPMTLTLLVATAIWLGARRSAGLSRWTQELAAWALVVCVALAVRPPALALLGGLALGTLARAPRLRKPAVLAGGLMLAGVTVLWSSASLQATVLHGLESMGGVFAQNAQRIQVKFDPNVTPGLLLARTLGWGIVPLTREGSGGFAHLAPAVVGVATLGGLLALGDRRRLTSAGSETLLVFFGWALLFVLGSGLIRTGDRPLRYYALMGPPLAAFAGFAATWFIDSRSAPTGARARGVSDSAEAPKAPEPQAFERIAAVDKGWVAGAAAFGAVTWTHLLGLLSPPQATLPIAGAEGACMGLLTLVVMTALGWPKRPSAAGARRLAALLVSASVLPGLLRSVYATSTATTYARDANRAAGQILDPESALLIGPYASFLAIGHGLKRRRGGNFTTRPGGFDDTLARLRPKTGRWATHLAVDAQQERSAHVVERFAERGFKLVLVAVLSPSRPPGHPVFLYRFPWAEERGYRLSPFERRRRLDTKEGTLVGEQDTTLLFARTRALSRSGSERRSRAVRKLFDSK